MTTHLTSAAVKEEYNGAAFNEIKDGSVENIFLRWLDRSPDLTESAVALPSINAVSPDHVFFIPAPEAMGVTRDEQGNWHNLPADSYMNLIPEYHRMGLAGAFFDWVSVKHREASGLDPSIKIQESYMTVNEGPMSSRAVLYPHVHDLIILDDKDYEHPAVQALMDVDRFIRKPDRDVMELLREADQKHLEGFPDRKALGKIFRKAESEFRIPFGLAATGFIKNHTDEEGYVDDRVFIEREQDPDRRVRPGHTKIRIDTQYDPDSPASGFTREQFQKLEYYAGQLKQAFVRQGAQGFTVVMDTTALRNPQAQHVIGQVDNKGRIALTYEIIPHPAGVPFVKGGLVYPLQIATAPAFAHK